MPAGLVLTSCCCIRAGADSLAGDRLGAFNLSIKARSPNHEALVVSLTHSGSKFLLLYTDDVRVVLCTAVVRLLHAKITGLSGVRVENATDMRLMEFFLVSKHELPASA